MSTDLFRGGMDTSKKSTSRRLGYSPVSDYPSGSGGADTRVPFGTSSTSNLRSCNILPTASSSDRKGKKSQKNEDSGVMIEEKRRRANGEGYTTHKYLRGKLLGKGGFAKVYLCTAMDTSKQYAVKVVPKTNLVKPRARQKLQTEIKIHRTLKHPNICEYKHFFEDRENCYILLELCHNQSLNEMIKRRKRLTEPEAAFFMNQLLEAVQYMHQHKSVIHRDLKLGNLFLDRSLNVKVGDLGLATVMDDPDEKRKTICGTPNYIAPEVIQGDKSKRGHSFEVDIWSMGVILYTVLVGKPPYEAKDVKSTYQRILSNEYHFPTKIELSSVAKDLIRRMLRSNPNDRYVEVAPHEMTPDSGPLTSIYRRPSLREIANHSFLSDRFVPASIPSSSTHSAPQWRVDANGDLVCDDHHKAIRKPLAPRSRKPFASCDMNHSSQPLKKLDSYSSSVLKTVTTCVAPASSCNKKKTPSRFQIYEDTKTASQSTEAYSHRQEVDLVKLTNALAIASPARSVKSQVSAARSTYTAASTDDSEILKRLCSHVDTVLEVTSRRRGLYRPKSPRPVGPHASPMRWVLRYVDYTSKYGLGFMLNDGSSGVYFNDATKAALDRDAMNFQYIERRRVENDRRVELVVGNHTLTNYPASLKKKVTLLKHFHSYLTEQQKKAGVENYDNLVSDSLSPAVVFVKKWIRSKHALLFRLSDQTIQVVFYDQTEILLTPDDRYITYVDKNQVRNTYNFTDELVGGFGELEKRLKYAKEIMDQLGEAQK